MSVIGTMLVATYWPCFQFHQHANMQYIQVTKLGQILLIRKNFVLFLSLRYFLLPYTITLKYIYISRRSTVLDKSGEKLPSSLVACDFDLWHLPPRLTTSHVEEGRI